MSNSISSYVNNYLSQVQVSSQIAKEYQDLIKDFLTYTQETQNPFLMDYFQLQTMDIVYSLPNNLDGDPHEIWDLNNDPDFSAVKLHFETYKDPKDPQIYQSKNKDTNIQGIKEEFSNWILSECPDTVIYFDFNEETESLDIYTICY